MTIEEHIENLKAIASDMPSDKCSDWIESLMAGINAMKELKAHREAWVKILDEMMNVSIPGQDAEYVYQNIYDIIKKYRPKEGDTK
jgi:hypothetical protein